MYVFDPMQVLGVRQGATHLCEGFSPSIEWFDGVTYTAQFLLRQKWKCACREDRADINKDIELRKVKSPHFFSLCGLQLFFLMYIDYSAISAYCIRIFVIA